LGTTLFFSADNVQSGIELWKTDGSAAGTVLVKDINPGITGSAPDHFQVMGNLLFFTANDGVAGRELWVTDGTAAGTILLADIRPGTASAFEDWFFKLDFRDFHVFQNHLFFRAYTSQDGLELYKSDGTPAGTGLVKNIGSLANDGCQGDFAELNGELYFVGFTTNHGGQIWKTDGTNAGTIEVTSTLNETPEDLTRLGNQLIFLEDDGINGPEPWKSDGTAAATALLKDTDPMVGSGGLAHTVSATEGRFFVAGNNAYFSVIDEENDSQIWITDGTEGGTQKLKSVGSSACPASNFARLGNSVLFLACNFGDYLWKTNGSAVTTQTVKGFSGGIFPAGFPDFPLLKTHEDEVWFGASPSTSTDLSLYKTNGSAAGTEAVGTFLISHFYDPQRFFSFGDKLVFWAKTSVSDDNFEPYIYKPLLAITGTITAASCNGSSDGSITVQPAGTAPFTAAWQPAAPGGL
ncbi:MAG: ELWxxDGT repeat protein, partial [Saprospiraceae bacterium]